MECSKKDSYGKSIPELQIKMKENMEERKALITILNEYVDEYNKNEENNLKLKRWKYDEGIEYPILNFD